MVYLKGTISTGFLGGACGSGALHARARRLTQLQKGDIADRNWLNRASGLSLQQNRRGVLSNDFFFGCPKPPSSVMKRGPRLLAHLFAARWECEAGGGSAV